MGVIVLGSPTPTQVRTGLLGESDITHLAFCYGGYVALVKYYLIPIGFQFKRSTSEQRLKWLLF